MVIPEQFRNPQIAGAQSTVFLSFRLYIELELSKALHLRIINPRRGLLPVRVSNLSAPNRLLNAKTINKMSSDGAVQELIRYFIDVTGVETDRAKFYLDSTNWDLSVSWSDFIRGSEV